jgi:hypothetical protein
MPHEASPRSGLLAILFFLVIPLALVLAINLQVDRAKPLWFDELIVSHAASQPHLSDVWKILTSGQSPHPPLNFLVVRCMYAAFGNTELTTRLPSTLGYAAMSVCLFFFVSRRTNAAFGTLAMLFPLITLARVYAVEAKPYGALLGWTGVALICWRYTGGAETNLRVRRWALAGLGLALACATCSHFFGVMLGFPILAGEAVRSFERRRLDWALVAVITLNYWPLVFLAPILRAGNQVHGLHPWQTVLGFGFIFKSVDLLLAGAAAPVLLGFIVVAALRALTPPDQLKASIPLDEIAAATALALLPIAAFLGLKTAGLKIIEEKYLITMVVGVAILFAWSTYSVSGPKLATGIALAAILALWGGRDFIRDLRAAQDEMTTAKAFAPPSKVSGLGPLPIISQTQFMMLEHYARPEIADRVYFLLDPEASQRYFGSDATQRSIALNPSFFGTHVEKIGEFDATHRDFLIYESLQDGPGWVLERYKDHGARIELVDSSANGRWYLVRPHSDIQ